MSNVGFRAMLRGMLVAAALAHAASLASAQPDAPYAGPAANDIYNLLFCDVNVALRPHPGEEPTPWQAVLFAVQSDPVSLRALASGAANEGPTRMLAYNRLRAIGEGVPKGVLLDVIAEVGLVDGLDALAAFSDGAIRYVNQSGKMLLIEDKPSETIEIVPRLLAASQAVVNRLGPSLRPRQPPPKQGNMRLTFLVSDGLYSGEGPAEAMQRDPLASEVALEATQLLLAVVKIGTR